MGENEIPQAFRNNRTSAMNGITKGMFRHLLNGYIPNPVDREQIMRNFDGAMHRFSGQQINSMSQALEYIGGARHGQRWAQEAVNTAAIANRQQQLSALGETAENPVVLYRGDNRNYEQIRRAGGFQGWGGSMTEEHMQFHQEHYLNPLTAGNAAAYTREQVAATASSKAQRTQVSLGTEAPHLGTNPYMITAPSGAGIPEYSRRNIGNFNARGFGGTRVAPEEVAMMRGVIPEFIRPVNSPTHATSPAREKSPRERSPSHTNYNPPSPAGSIDDLEGRMSRVTVQNRGAVAFTTAQNIGTAARRTPRSPMAQPRGTAFTTPPRGAAASRTPRSPVAQPRGTMAFTTAQNIGAAAGRTSRSPVAQSRGAAAGRTSRSPVAQSRGAAASRTSRSPANQGGRVAGLARNFGGAKKTGRRHY